MANKGEISRGLAGKATDLQAIAAANEAKRLEQEKRKEAEARVVVAKWDAKMRAAFKGIMPSPQRYRMMRESYARREARGEA